MVEREVQEKVCCAHGPLRACLNLCSSSHTKAKFQRQELHAEVLNTSIIASSFATTTMDTDNISDNAELRRRVTGLEKELELAQARLAAKKSTDAALALHRHHSQANLHAYGHSDSIVFVEPEEHPDFFAIQAKLGGLNGAVCRGVIKMNLDQFLQRPRLHQWMQGGKIYREATERVSS